MITEMKAVESSTIKAMGHDPVHNLMRVEFKNGGIYDYQNVSKETFEHVIGAESIGSEFSRTIKKAPATYPYTKVQ